jgi:hypothetical protein
MYARHPQQGENDQGFLDTIPASSPVPGYLWHKERVQKPRHRFVDPRGLTSTTLCLLDPCWLTRRCRAEGCASRDAGPPWPPMSLHLERRGWCNIGDACRDATAASAKALQQDPRSLDRVMCMRCSVGGSSAVNMK